MYPVIFRIGLPEDAGNVGGWGVAGGIVGAKLLFVAEHLHEAPLTALLFDRSGLSWFGGLAGGIAARAAFPRRWTECIRRSSTKRRSSPCSPSF